jgi:hypothetical protein
MRYRNSNPLTSSICDWASVPVAVRTVEAVAPLLGRSVRSIERDLSTGRMDPPPLPRRGREAWAWSKASLMRFHGVQR